MTADETTRFYKDRVLRALGFGRVFEFLKFQKIRPNHISMLGFLIGSISTLFMFSNWRIFVVMYLTYIILDNLDGSYARYIGKTDRKGDVFDHTADSIIWILVIISAALHQGELWAVWAILVCVVNTLLVFLIKAIEDWRMRGIYLLFYLIGENSLGLQFEIVYVSVTIVVRLGSNMFGYLKSAKMVSGKG